MSFVFGTFLHSFLQSLSIFGFDSLIQLLAGKMIIALNRGLILQMTNTYKIEQEVLRNTVLSLKLI